jgi:hypothetical protein
MLTGRLQREIAETLRGTYLDYRVTWPSGERDTFTAFDYRDAYRMARSHAERRSKTATFEACWPVRIVEVATGRTWRFECVGNPIEETPA